MRRVAGSARLVLAAVLLMTLTGCTTVLDQRFVYYPEPWQSRDWAAASGLPLQDVRFHASDGVQLHGWLVNAPGSPATLLWCHGNAANVINRLEHIAVFYRHGLSVFIVDYRGYGQSQGRPSEPGLYRDALAAYDYLTRAGHVSPERLVVYGQSLGAAVAGDLASRRRVSGLILEAPFPSIPAVVRTYYGWLPLHWFLQARYNLVQRLKSVHAPVLVLHGDRDQTIPLALGRSVYESANPPKDFYLVRNADHNDLYLVGGAAYVERLLAFVREVTARAGK